MAMGKEMQIGNNGRKSTPKGRKMLDQLSTELKKELEKEYPALKKY